MIPITTKREFEKGLQITERKLIKKKIESNPDEYQMNNIFIADGYRG